MIKKLALVLKILLLAYLAFILALLNFGFQTPYRIIRWLAVGTAVILGLIPFLAIAGLGNRPTFSGNDGYVLPVSPLTTSAPYEVPIRITRQAIGRISGQIINVVNGDTLDISIAGESQRVRLLGIDAPEPGMCFGNETDTFLRNLVSNGFGLDVVVEDDPGLPNRDKFGRIQRYVWLSDGRMLNELLVAEGYAFEYTYFTPHRYAESWRNLEQSARSDGKGVWSRQGCNGSSERPDRHFQNIGLSRPSGVVEAYVVRVIDGDTFVVDINGQHESVRFIGIDTPETGRCSASEATQRTTELSDGKRVWLEEDGTQGNRDKFNRLLRYVWLEDGSLLNATLVAEGLAYEYTYSQRYRYEPEFFQLEHLAQMGGLGLWSPQTCDGLAGRRFSAAYESN